MRIALISDIHGNCFALDAALADLQSHAVDQIICLGDTLQGGAQPAETVKRLHALACPIVMGNADAWLLAEENDTAERGCLRLDFHRVPYDVEQLIQIIRSSGRMHANQMIAEYQRAN